MIQILKCQRTCWVSTWTSMRRRHGMPWNIWYLLTYVFFFSYDFVSRGINEQQHSRSFKKNFTNPIWLIKSFLKNFYYRSQYFIHLCPWFSQSEARLILIKVTTCSVNYLFIPACKVIFSLGLESMWISVWEDSVDMLWSLLSVFPTARDIEVESKCKGTLPEADRIQSSNSLILILIYLCSRLLPHLQSNALSEHQNQQPWIQCLCWIHFAKWIDFV